MRGDSATGDDIVPSRQDQLARLAALYASGTLTAKEFTTARARLLSGSQDTRRKKQRRRRRRRRRHVIVVALAVAVLAVGSYGIVTLTDNDSVPSLIPAVSGMGEYRIAECDDIASPGSNASKLTIEFKNTTSSAEKVVPGVEIDDNPIGTGLWDANTGGQLTLTSGYFYVAQPGQLMVMNVVTTRTATPICEQNLSVDFFAP